MSTGLITMQYVSCNMLFILISGPVGRHTGQPAPNQPAGHTFIEVACIVPCAILCAVPCAVSCAVPRPTLDPITAGNHACSLLPQALHAQDAARAWADLSGLQQVFEQWLGAYEGV